MISILMLALIFLASKGILMGNGEGLNVGLGDVLKGNSIRMEYEYYKELKFRIVNPRTGKSLNLIAPEYIILLKMFILKFMHGILMILFV